MNDVIPYIIILRYALLPKQLISFDYSADKDLYSYTKYFEENATSSLKSVEKFMCFVNSINNYHDISFETLSSKLVNFIISFPFLDNDELNQLDLYNPFKDFDKDELYSYFTTTDHIPIILNFQNDEINFSFIDSYEKYYNWYNKINNKSLKKLLYLYSEKLRRFVVSQ